MPDSETTRLFMGLFNGRKDVWGGVEGVSIKEPVTEEHYKMHLEGRRSMGVYPLLPDGTVHFFAVDLDEKSFEKATQIRHEIFKLDIKTYIAESKGKGYHIYGFVDGELQAKDIRVILTAALARLNIKAEIFPKQDALTANQQFGNYINLPCYGNTRAFKALNGESIPNHQALKLIQRNPADKIRSVQKPVGKPEPASAVTALAAATTSKKTSKKKTKHPPCIDIILKGVGQGCRDEAAFALARHYLDQGHTTDEVVALLEQWDKKNQPPINDEKQLRTKTESAGKGYHFGCKSIVEHPLLAGFCPGQDNCVWLAESVQDKKKKGLIVERTWHESEVCLYEQIVKDKDAFFLAYNRQSGEIAPVREIQDGEITIIPAMGPEVLMPDVRERIVKMPSGLEEYGTTVKLIEDIRRHILHYVDIPDRFLEFATWYVVMTWVFDKLPTVNYLRVTGDTGTGKSRALTVFGDLCYKAMVLAGAVTPAPIYRLIKRYGGTVLIEEADFNASDETSEVVKILNSGFERGRPIIRCVKDNPSELEILPCFGPKMFATRFRFQDIALEARCLTIVMEESDRELPVNLDKKEYRYNVDVLRNKLLLWRFRNRDRIDPDRLQEIELKGIEPRLKQTCIPFAMIFQDLPETVDRFKSFIDDYQGELIRERFDSIQGRVVYALFKLAESQGKAYVTSGAIAKMCAEELKLDVKPRKISAILKSLNVKTDKHQANGRQARYIAWNDKLMRKINRRYMPDKQEFLHLLDGTDGRDKPPEPEPEPEETRQESLGDI